MTLSLDVIPSLRKGRHGFRLYCENLVVSDLAACALNHPPRIACDEFNDAASALRKVASIKRLEVASIRTCRGETPMYGYTGKALMVNLTNRSFKIENLDEGFAKKRLGPQALV